MQQVFPGLAESHDRELGARAREWKPKPECSAVLWRSALVTKLHPGIHIYRAANLLIRQHGQDAPVFAATRADKHFKVGNVEGGASLKPIVKAVVELPKQEALEETSGRQASPPMPTSCRSSAEAGWTVGKLCQSAAERRAAAAIRSPAERR